MTIGQIEDRAGGPILVDTRVAVDDVLIYLLEPGMTEEAIGRLLGLSIEEVAATRGYILRNPDTTLARHLQIEARSEGAVNPPEVVEAARKARESLSEFKTWLEAREAAAARAEVESGDDSGRYPSFRDWIAGRVSRPASGD